MDEFLLISHLSTCYAVAKILTKRLHLAAAHAKIREMILVVDDDPEFLTLAEEILNRDRKVFLASNAKQAVNLAQDLGFSVALVDLDMRRENGLMLIRKMRATFPDLPIIAISCAFKPHILEEIKKVGAVELLQKPITRAWKPVLERVRATAHRR